MGVPGLWDVLRPAGQVHSLAHLAVEDGFVANASGKRAYRIGIDASIWFFHALGGREGENPELRTLFFRCARLLAMPYLPIFVFDGPGRPKIKRGKAVGGKEHWMVNSLRSVLDAFGFECRTAPGEAEAELAFLNRVGAIDAILSDDVDCFIFGAHTVMRNGSVTLSGNRAHATGDPQRIWVYRAEDIASNPAVNLTQGGLILVALLRGGDYDEAGISGCGVSTAHALARAGFGDRLLTAARTGRAALATLLPTWRAELREELRTNASKLAPRKCPTVAQRITDTFPSLEVLRCYTHPLTTERAGTDLATYGLGGLWKNSADVGKIAHVCERFFEWGFEEAVVKRFRTIIWPGAVLRSLLQAALERDRLETGVHGGVETPSKALARSLHGIALHDSDEDEDEETSSDENDDGIDAASLLKTIHSTRRHASTDNMLEYRVEIRPRALVLRTRDGIQGLRTVNQDSARDPGAEDEDGDEEGKIGKSPPDPDSVLRVWMPASMVEYACPRLVKRFEAKAAKKAAKKNAKGTGKGRKKKVQVLEEEESDVSPMKEKVAKHNRPIKPDKNTIKTKARHMKKCETEESASDSPPLNPMKSRYIHKSASSSSVLSLLDEDPFIVSAGLSPSHRKAGSGHVIPAASALPKPRPFPVSLENPDPSIPPYASRGRKHTVSSSSSSSSSFHANTNSTGFKKSPRKSAEHTSPRKQQVRAPSPSPMNPLERARMKSLHTMRPAASSARKDVIVISSDSDDQSPPAKPHFKVRSSKPTALGPSNSSDLGQFAEVIDLT